LVKLTYFQFLILSVGSFYDAACDLLYNRLIGKGKGKAVPLQAWIGPECSRKLRVPDFMTKVKQSRHRPGWAQSVPGS